MITFYPYYLTDFKERKIAAFNIETDVAHGAIAVAAMNVFQACKICNNSF